MHNSSPLDPFLSCCIEGIEYLAKRGESGINVAGLDPRNERLAYPCPGRQIMLCESKFEPCFFQIFWRREKHHITMNNKIYINITGRYIGFKASCFENYSSSILLTTTDPSLILTSLSFFIPYL